MSEEKNPAEETTSKESASETKPSKEAKATRETKASKTGFFKGLKSEFRKCTWPKPDDLMKQSALVMVVSVALGLLISGVDWLIRLGLQALQIVS